MRRFCRWYLRHWYKLLAMVLLVGLLTALLAGVGLAHGRHKRSCVRVYRWTIFCLTSHWDDWRPPRPDTDDDPPTPKPTPGPRRPDPDLCGAACRAT